MSCSPVEDREGDKGWMGGIQGARGGADCKMDLSGVQRRTTLGVLVFDRSVVADLGGRRLVMPLGSWFGVLIHRLGDELKRLLVGGSEEEETILDVEEVVRRIAAKKKRRGDEKEGLGT